MLGEQISFFFSTCYFFPTCLEKEVTRLWWIAWNFRLFSCAACATLYFLLKCHLLAPKEMLLRESQQTALSSQGMGKGKTASFSQAPETTLWVQCTKQLEIEQFTLPWLPSAFTLRYVGLWHLGISLPTCKIFSWTTSSIHPRGYKLQKISGPILDPKPLSTEESIGLCTYS